MHQFNAIRSDQMALLRRLYERDAEVDARIVLDDLLTLGRNGLLRFDTDGEIELTARGLRALTPSTADNSRN
jgi:hypothetical protein